MWCSVSTQETIRRSQTNVVHSRRRAWSCACQTMLFPLALVSRQAFERRWARFGLSVGSAAWRLSVDLIQKSI